MIDDDREVFVRNLWRVEVPRADDETLAHALRAIIAGRTVFNPWQVEMIRNEIKARVADGRMPNPLPDVVAQFLMVEACDG